MNEELATTGAPVEQCIGLPLAHMDLCRLEDNSGVPSQMVMSWLQAVLWSSAKNIEERMRSCRYCVSKRCTRPAPSLGNRLVPADEKS